MAAPTRGRTTQTEKELERAHEEAATDPIRAKAAAVVLALLREAYGEPEWPILDPLSSLVEVLLSHRTADPQTWAAYLELRRRFPTWEQVRDAPVSAIQEAIQGTTWPEQKAPRIKSVLQKITEERGDLDLSFLNDIPLKEADAWLQHLGGVGPKSAACVLLFACHRPLLPVDTHVHRVSIRLGYPRKDRRQCRTPSYPVSPTRPRERAGRAGLPQDHASARPAYLRLARPQMP